MSLHWRQAVREIFFFVGFLALVLIAFDGPNLEPSLSAPHSHQAPRVAVRR